MIARSGIAGEIGTAIAVLAIYVLTLLAPLHHARASQIAFDSVGYPALEAGWVVCSAGGVLAGDAEAEPVKCPALGIGKPVLPAPPAIALAADRRAHASLPAPWHHDLLVPPASPPTGLRGPPVPL